MSSAQTESNSGATFTIKIRFARNATWQGTIDWMEGKKTVNFRSEMEMLKLMMEAVSCEDELVTWE